MRRLPLFQRGFMAVVALVAGLLAAWAARHHIQGRIDQIEAEARVPTVARLVAAYDLEAGMRLDAEYVAVREIPVQWAVNGTLEPEAYADMAGSVLAYPIRRGDPILAMHLAKRRELALSERVQAGRRAVTIPVDEINSLSGMLQVGDLLDLYVSFEHRRRHVTAPLLQGVLVLATGGRAEDDESTAQTFSTVTLDAGPEDAVKLVAARQAGTITAILRHHRDDRPAAAAARGDLAGLLGLESADDGRGRAVPVLYGDQWNGGALAVVDEDDAQPGDSTGLFRASVPTDLVSAPRHKARSQAAALRRPRGLTEGESPQ
jgi:pilus assembly protein CpaB